MFKFQLKIIEVGWDKVFLWRREVSRRNARAITTKKGGNKLNWENVKKKQKVLRSSYAQAKDLTDT